MSLTVLVLKDTELLHFIVLAYIIERHVWPSTVRESQLVQLRQHFAAAGYPSL